MRVIRWMLGVAGALLLLAVAAVVVATRVIDPNAYKPKLETIIGDLTGKPFTINGDLRLTWFPWLGVRTGPARLGRSPALVEWQGAEVSARLIPLLHGELIVSRIRLDHPHIYLHRDAAGRGNWEDLLARTARPTHAGAQTAAPPQIAGLEIRDGTLEFADDKSSTHWRLASWQLDVGAWDGSQPLPVTTRFVLQGGPLPPAGVPVEIDAPRVSLRTSPLSVAIPTLALQVADANIEGTVNLAAVARATASPARRDLPATSGPDGLRANGSLAARIPSLRDLMRTVGMESVLPRDPETLKLAALKSTWSWDEAGFALKPLELQVDSTRLAGWLEQRSGSPSTGTAEGPQAAWSFELHGDRIDLQRYMQSEKPREKPFELPVNELRALRAQGTLVFDEALLAGARMKDVRLRLE